MDMRDGVTLTLVGRAHRGPELGQCLTTSDGSQEECIGRKGRPDPPQRLRKVVDGIERTQRHAKVVAAWHDVQPVFDDARTACRFGEAPARVENHDIIRKVTEAVGPGGIGASDQQGGSEDPPNQAKAIETVFENAFEKEHFRAAPEGTISAHCAKFHVEQFGGHAGACAMPRHARQVGG
jgi:hypothetical protein